MNVASTRSIGTFGCAFIVTILAAGCTPNSSVESVSFGLQASSPAGQGKGNGDACAALGHDVCCAHGYEVVQTQRDTLSKTTVSSLGSSTTQYAQSAPTVPTRGAIVRYADEKVFALDYGAMTYLVGSVDDLLQQRASERARYGNGTGGPGPLPLPTVVRLDDDNVQIAGMNTHAFLRTDSSGTVWRLHYATELPVPQRSLRKKLAELSPIAGPNPDPSDTAGDDNGQSLGIWLAGRTVLRTEAQTANGWTTVLDTQSVTRVGAPCANYDPPTAWTSMPLPPPSTAGGTLGPPLPDRPGGPGTPGSGKAPVIIKGPGPFIMHPELHIYFWGTTFAKPSHAAGVAQLVQSVTRVWDANYGGRLQALYDGVGQQGTIAEVHTYDEDPPPKAGGSDINGTIPGFLFDKAIHGDAPMFWWRVGSPDPLDIVYVQEEIVEDKNLLGQSVSGSHWIMPQFFQETLLPFPINLFVYDGIPFAMVKVADHALDLPTEGLLFRDDCHSYLNLDLCTIIKRFDDATKTTGHEYVEAATNPFPELGFFNAYALQTADYDNVELADICADSPPWGERTRIGDTILATFWSRSEFKCVPDSIPTIKIVVPSNGATIAWQGPNGPRITLQAVANDPVDGDNTVAILSGITWSIDGSTFGPAGSGPQVTSPPLALGPHTIRATVMDSQGATAFDEITVTVVATLPEITIFSPVGSVTYAADDTIVYRGDGFDFSDGPLSPLSLVWQLDGVQIGTGRTFKLAAPPQGQHSVSLTGTNSAGLSKTVFVSITVGPAQGKPFVQITAPVNGFELQFSGNVTFKATATNPDGSIIPDADVSWSSSIDGFLGTGHVLTAPLSGGNCNINDHVITVTVTGANGKTNTDTIIVHVGEIC